MGKKWGKVVKSGEKLERWEKWGKVDKSGEKLEKVGKSWKKWGKIGKSGEKCGKWGKVTKWRKVGKSREKWGKVGKVGKHAFLNFGCPKITFDHSSCHFRSIRNFFFLIFGQNGRRRPFWIGRQCQLSNSSEIFG